MMPKGLIAFILVAGIGLASLLIIYMKKSAIEARKRSDDILEQFKTVDKDLQKTNERLDSARDVLFDSLKKMYK